MQESTLHGWRIADAKHMRMSGYSARVRSLGWTADGDRLATSGAEQLILSAVRRQGWPDGPAAENHLPPRRRARHRRLACHPRQPVVAAGYADGVVTQMVRIDDGALILQ